jgi:hypothetical protein
MFREFELEIAPSQYMSNRVPPLCRKLIFLNTSHFWFLFRWFLDLIVYRNGEEFLRRTGCTKGNLICLEQHTDRIKRHTKTILALLYGFTEFCLHGRNHRVPISVAAQSKGCTVLHHSNAATSAYVFVILCRYRNPRSPTK